MADTIRRRWHSLHANMQVLVLPYLALLAVTQVGSCKLIHAPAVQLAVCEQLRYVCSALGQLHGWFQALDRCLGSAFDGHLLCQMSRLRLLLLLLRLPPVLFACCAQEVRSLHGLASAVLGKVQTAAEADANNEAVSELQPEQEQK